MATISLGDSMPAPPPKSVRRPLDLPGLGKTSHARQAFVISWVSVTLSVVAAAVGIWLSIVEGSLVDAESVSLFDAPLGHAQ